MCHLRWTALCFALSIVGCGGCQPTTPDGSTNTDPPPSRPPDVPPPDDSRPLGDLNIPDLIENTGHEDPARKMEAEDALLAAGAPAVVPKLIEALDDNNWHVRAGAICTLGRFGKEASTALEKLREVNINDDVSAVRDAAAFAIDAIQGN